MANGVIYGSTNNQYIKCKIEWSSVENVANNTSSVTAKLYYWRTNTGYTTSGAESYTLNINGVSNSVSRGYSDGIVLTNSTPVLAHTFTTTVSHNADGTKSITISASGGKTSGSFRSTTCSGTAILGTIPRATKPVVNTPSLKLGETLSFTITPASSGFRHDLQIMFAGQYNWYGSKYAGGTYTYTLPKDFAQRIPNALSASGSVRCWTYNGDTQIGYAEASFTAAVSDDTVPSVSLTVSEAVSNIAAQFGAYIKTKSKWKLTASGTGIYGSTIKSYKLNANSMTYNSASATTDYLTKAGTNQLTATVTDSRGHSKTATVSVNVLDYGNPQITAFSVIRTNQDGTFNDEGTYAKVSFSWNIFACNNKNTKSAQIKYKKHSDSSYQSQAVTLSGYSGNTSVILSGIDIDNTYDVVLSISDYFSTVERSTSIPTAYTLVDYRSGGKGIAFGKVSERDGMEVGFDAYFEKNVMANNVESRYNFVMNSQNDDTSHAIINNKASKNNVKWGIYGGGSNSDEIMTCYDYTNTRAVYIYFTSGDFYMYRPLRCNDAIYESGERLLHRPKILWSGSLALNGTATMNENFSQFSFIAITVYFGNQGYFNHVAPTNGITLNGSAWYYIGNPANVSSINVAVTMSSNTLKFVGNSNQSNYRIIRVSGIR